MSFSDWLENRKFNNLGLQHGITSKVDLGPDFNFGPDFNLGNKMDLGPKFDFGIKLDLGLNRKPMFEDNLARLSNITNRALPIITSKINLNKLASATSKSFEKLEISDDESSFPEKKELLTEDFINKLDERISELENNDSIKTDSFDKTCTVEITNDKIRNQEKDLEAIISLILIHSGFVDSAAEGINNLVYSTYDIAQHLYTTNNSIRNITNSTISGLIVGIIILIIDYNFFKND